MRIGKDIMSGDQTQKIGLVTATLICMTAMIGAGIYTVPSMLGSSLGPAGILTTLLVAVSVLLIAISIGRVANMYPQAGSFYIYASQWGGHTMGLIASGAYIIGFLIAGSVLCRYAGINLHHSFPQVPAWALSTIVIALISILHLFGARVSSVGQYILICCAVIPLLLIGGACWAKASLANLVPFAPYGFASILLGMREVVFCFTGFESATSLVSIIENPKRNVPKALMFAVILVALLYLFFISGIILAVPLSALADSSVPLSVSLQGVIAPWLLKIMHAAITATIIGALYSITWGVSVLLNSIMQLVRNQAIVRYVKTGFINAKSCVIFVGIAVLTGFLILKSKQLFYLTALFVVFAYLTAITALLADKKEWHSPFIILTVFSFLVAFAIFIFAAQGIVESLIMFCVM